MSPTERLLAGAFLFFFAALLGLEMLRGHELVRWSMLFMLLAWGPLIVVHELGHVVAARLSGFAVSEFVVGQGPPILRTRVRGARVILRAVPVSGYVMPHSVDGRRARLGMALTYAGGPLAELLLVGLIALALGPDLLSRSDHLGVVAAQSVALAASMGAIMNLLPLPAGEAVTDGLGMWLSLSLGDAEFSFTAAMRHVEEAEIALDDDRPEDALAAVACGQKALPDHALLLVEEAVCRAALGDEASAMELLERVRGLAHLSQRLEAESLHAAARVVLELRDRSLLTDAREACRSALRLGARPQFLITMGRVQLALAQPEQALETLQEAYKLTKEPFREDRCLTYLAQASAEVGDPVMHARYQDELRGRGPGRRLLREAGLPQS